MRRPVFTVEPGRNLHVDGVPFASVRVEGRTMPYHVDAMTRVIARVMNGEPIKVDDVVWVRPASIVADEWSGPADVVEIAEWPGKPVQYLVRFLSDREVWFGALRLI